MKYSATYKNAKTLGLFFIASSSLLLSGGILSSEVGYIEIAVLLLCNLCGTVLIYRINDFIDCTKSAQLNLFEFFKVSTHLFYLVLLILVGFPLAFIVLTKFSVIILGCAAIIGILYSINFRLNDKIYRLKNVFLLKNISIGVVWGALVFIGAGDYNNNLVVYLFIFISIQVFIGSMIRDIPDREKDKLNNVHSFPVLFGKNKTFVFMHIVNVSSLLLFIFVNSSENIFNLMLIVVGWRFISLLKLKQNEFSKFWGQTINLFTCSLVFIVLLTQHLYELYSRN